VRAVMAGGASSLPWGAGGNGWWRGRFASWRGTFSWRLLTKAVLVNTQVPASSTPQRWRWTAATPTARRTCLTPLGVTDPTSIGPPSWRYCARFGLPA